MEMELTKSIQHLKIRLSFDYTWSLTFHIGNLGCACAYIFQKKKGVLIGACALNRVRELSNANSVIFTIFLVSML